MIDCGPDLRLQPVVGSAWQLLLGPVGPVSAIRLDEDRSRLRFGLALLGGKNIVEVTNEPSTWVKALDYAARSIRENPDRWLSAVSRGIDRWCRDRGWWTKPLDKPAMTVASAGWPLLRPAVTGGQWISSVPRWACGLLSGPNLPSALEREVGHFRSDRRVVRLTAETLKGPVGWWPLAVLLSVDCLDAGRPGDMLSNTSNQWSCSQHDFHLLERVLGSTQPTTAAGLLGSVDQAGGPARLMRALDSWHRTGWSVAHLPRNIDEIERRAQEVLTAQANGRCAEAPEQRRGARRAAFHPPQTPPVPPTAVFDYPPSWLNADGQRSGEVELRLPVDHAQLKEWGAILRNCLANFRAAIIIRRALVLGIFIDGRIRGAVQVNPARREIVQLSASQNRQLPTPVERQVVELLRSLKLIERRPEWLRSR
ncbi:MAG: hypothetical protein KJN63_07945 [Acidimicrobiia bacterium]|nr:hypothetical protein [Acidimicrobiia bacterium]